ncbi:hypothetical protein JCM14469_26910 [Desulfatiferula olefinivorans]
MEEIKIIKDKAELEGTCYIELSLGKYQGKHWEKTSLFFEEEVFGLIEPIFEKIAPNYDHYNMNDIDSNSWDNILSELKALNALLESTNDFEDILGKVGFIFAGSRDYFQNHLLSCKDQLIKLITELVEWVENNIKEHGCIAVLGI